MSDLMLLPMYLCSFSNTCFTSCGGPSAPKREDYQAGGGGAALGATRGEHTTATPTRARSHARAMDRPYTHLLVERPHGGGGDTRPDWRRAEGGVRCCGAVVWRCGLCGSWYVEGSGVP